MFIMHGVLVGVRVYPLGLSQTWLRLYAHWLSLIADRWSCYYGMEGGLLAEQQGLIEYHYICTRFGMLEIETKSANETLPTHDSEMVR